MGIFKKERKEEVGVLGAEESATPNIKVGADEYYTRNLYFAAYLKTVGANMVRMEVDSAMTYFIFSDKKSCRLAERGYWDVPGSRELVDPKKFIDTVFECRRMARGNATEDNPYVNERR